jgi:hypothetical protein
MNDTKHPILGRALKVELSFQLMETLVNLVDCKDPSMIPFILYKKWNVQARHVYNPVNVHQMNSCL